MNLIGQSAVIFLSLLNCVACQLQLQCYQKPKWFKKCPIVVPQAQTLQTSLIILVDLTVLILSDKLLLNIQLTHTFMPNMIHKPWMVSNIHGYQPYLRNGHLCTKSAQKQQLLLVTVFVKIQQTFYSIQIGNILQNVLWQNTQQILSKIGLNAMMSLDIQHHLEV